MEYIQGSIRLSATDVANHLSCKHLTTLNLLLAKGALSPPDWANPDLKVLQQLGLDHEKAYVDNLRSTGLSIIDISQEGNSRGATLDAMKKGVLVIVQANLASGEWIGRADVLLRVDQPSALGGWSYEAVDCKLSRTTKAETILQLCFYSELLTDVQGHEPELFHVIRPHTNYEPESHRFSQYAAYYRYVKRAVKHAVESANGNPPLSNEEMAGIAESICRYSPGNNRSRIAAGCVSDSPLFWFPFFINDWLANPDIRLMDDRQHGWLINLMATAFQQRGFLANDPDKLWRWAGASSKIDFEPDSQLVLNQFEIHNLDGVPKLVHPKLAAHWIDALQKIEQKSRAGKASAKVRAGRS